MIIKNEIPILEYDDNSLEVIAPDHELEDIRLPEKCLFTFLGDVVHEYAKGHNAEVVKELITVSHTYKVYVLHEEKEDICLVQSLIGAAAATQVLDTLVSVGCKKVIAVGSCGVLAQIPENAFLVPVKALRAEGTSYHYLPASRYIELDKEPIEVIENTFKAHGLPFVTCTTWTTDGFFRETKDMVKYRLEEGCSVVEMECSALAACCKKRGASFGQFLFTADSLANVHEYDARDFGFDSHQKALELGFDILRKWISSNE
jgi:uridine phosphorylase